MKVTKFNKSKTLKAKIYKYNIIDRTGLKVEDVEKRLKKVLNVIFNFSVFEKQILFIGNFPLKNKSVLYLLKDTSHVIMDLLCFNRNAYTLKRLKRRPDLIITFGQAHTDEFKKRVLDANLPIINVGGGLNISNGMPTYKLPGDFSNDLENDLFWGFVSAILKKAKFLKKNRAPLSKAFFFKQRERFICDLIGIKELYNYLKKKQFVSDYPMKNFSSNKPQSRKRGCAASFRYKLKQNKNVKIIQKKK